MPVISCNSLDRAAAVALAMAVAVTIAAPAAATGPEAAVWQAVLPDATRIGAIEGDPPAAAAYRDDTLVGYVFHTRDVVASVGFSGKPLDVAVGLDLDARITGAKIVEHHEPILIIGVPEERLLAFVAQYRGRDVREPVPVLRRHGAATGGIDAVSGATISSLVLNDGILRAARAVGRSRGLLGGAASLVLDAYQEADWPALIADGSLTALRLGVGEVERALADQGARLYPATAGVRDPDTTFIDLYLRLATPARIGRNLVGDRLYNRALGELSHGDHLVFVAAQGLYSFKGTGYVRSGTFDRVQLVQGERAFRFRRDDHRRVDRLRIANAPEPREAALFVLRAADGFDAAKPWRLELLVGGERDDGTQAFVAFTRPYELPRLYIRAPPAAAEEEIEPLWLQIWRGRVVDVVILCFALVVLTGILFAQDALAGRRRLHRWVRYGFLGFTLVWLGWWVGAQLSVLNVLTFAEALRTQFRWDFFLLEPLMFVLWSYVAMTLLFWGRGVFCGWLCPFGALQELLNQIGRLLRVPQLAVPFAVHERLWPIKYILFLGLFALSLHGMELAQVATEVEPFKTAIVFKFGRELGFVVYPVALLALGLVNERFFCRYLCPLGGALAIPARLRMFEWLKRRWQCGTQCQTCAVRCPVQAIHPNGRINPNECIHCLNCQVNYYDDLTCPPLVDQRKRREVRAARQAAIMQAAASETAHAQ
jgi:transcriptional regulator of nitric oxide reductase